MISNIDINFNIGFNDPNDQDQKNYIRLLNQEKEIQIGPNETKSFNVLLNENLKFKIFSRKYLGLDGSIRININNNGEISCAHTIDTPSQMDFTYDKENNTIILVITNRRNNLNKVENNSFFTFDKSRFDRNECSLKVSQRNSAKKPIFLDIGDTRRNTIPPLRKIIAKVEINSKGEKIKKETIICNFSPLSSVIYDLTTLDKNGKELGKGHVTLTLNEKSSFCSKVFEIDFKKTKMPPSLIIKSIHHKGKGTEFIIAHEYCLVGTASS
ncbi:hypothetical protein ACTFIV_000892 [Dictyostelium citrinum]